jgi:hypothetical protein
MGYANSDLIRACEKSRKENAKSFPAILAAVRATQEECPHPQGDHRRGTKHWQPDLQDVVWCCRCGLKLSPERPYNAAGGGGAGGNVNPFDWHAVVVEAKQLLLMLDDLTGGHGTLSLSLEKNARLRAFLRLINDRRPEHLPQSVNPEGMQIRRALDTIQADGHGYIAIGPELLARIRKFMLFAQVTGGIWPANSTPTQS